MAVFDRPRIGFNEGSGSGLSAADGLHRRSLRKLQILLCTKAVEALPSVFGLRIKVAELGKEKDVTDCIVLVARQLT